MRKLILAILFIMPIILFGQSNKKTDKIIFTNGNIKNCIVVLVNNDKIEFKNKKRGSIQTIPTKDVFMVIDENDEQLYFYGCKTAPASTTQAPNNSPTTPIVQNDCNKNKTGDVTFTNKSSGKLVIKITGIKYLDNSGNGIINQTTGTTDYTIGVGETITIKNVLVGTYSYSAETPTFGTVVSQGQVYIELCKVAHKDIQ